MDGKILIQAQYEKASLSVFTIHSFDRMAIEMKSKADFTLHVDINSSVAMVGDGGEFDPPPGHPFEGTPT